MAFPFGRVPQLNNTNSTTPVSTMEGQLTPGGPTGHGGLGTLHSPEYLAFISQQAAFFNPPHPSLNAAPNHGDAAPPNLALNATHHGQAPPALHPAYDSTSPALSLNVPVKRARLTSQGYHLAELEYTVTELENTQQELSARVRDLELKLSATIQRIEQLELASTPTTGPDTSLESISVSDTSSLSRPNKQPGAKERKAQNTPLQVCRSLLAMLPILLILQ